MLRKIFFLSILVVLVVVPLQVEGFEIKHANHSLFLPDWELEGMEIIKNFGGHKSIVEYDLTYAGDNTDCSIFISMLVTKDSQGFTDAQLEYYENTYAPIADRKYFNCNEDPIIKTSIYVGEEILYSLSIQDGINSNDILLLFGSTHVVSTSDVEEDPNISEAES